MRSEQEVINQLRRWADAQPNVRTLILTSSRADPHRQPDLLSDYDVEVFVRDVSPFTADDAWGCTFGRIMVRWPMTPRPTLSDEWITQLVLYEDGTRIDFQITSLPPGASGNLDTGYRVLVDKDDAAPTLPEPTHTQYQIQPPTPEAFAERINAFWWDIVYVAKALHRGELTYAKQMLEDPVRMRKLHPLIEWYIVLHHEAPGPPVSTDAGSTDTSSPTSGRSICRPSPARSSRITGARSSPL
jgi:aminoglycoside 6-adenylyltransferase